VAIGLALLLGNRDEGKLTNLVFFARHPERRGRKLTPGETQFDKLRKEWLDIRERLVKPALSRISAAASGPAVLSSLVAAASGDERQFKRRKRGGWARYGGRPSG
jgi:hypothetical protein